MQFKEVTQFIRDLVALGGIYAVDDDGYVINKSDETLPVLLKDGNQFKRILVLQEVMSDKDAIILNPLHENTAESADGRWLFIGLSGGLSRRIALTVRAIRDVIEAGDDIHAAPEILQFAARHHNFDAKALEHFEIISKNKLEFLNVFYNRKLKEAKLRCSVFDEDTKTLYPNVTKKSWLAIHRLMADLLGLDMDPTKTQADLEHKYTVNSDLITVPKLESTLSVYLKLYTQLNRYLTVCQYDDDDFIVDITTLGAHINNLPEYYNKCKWFSGQVLAEKETVVPTQSAPPSNIPSNNFMQAQAPMMGYPQPTGGGGIPDNPAKHGSFAGPASFGMGISAPPITYANGRPMTEHSNFGNRGYMLPPIMQNGFLIPTC